jgi:hypothetical protein
MKKPHTKHTSSPPSETPELLVTLAGMMADEFNNILTMVMGACSLIDRDDPANAELLRCVVLIRASAEHAADLSGRLMHAGTIALENACSDVHPLASGSAGTSVRDKKSGDDIVSCTKSPGGAPS